MSDPNEEAAKLRQELLSAYMNIYGDSEEEARLKLQHLSLDELQALRAEVIHTQSCLAEIENSSPDQTRNYLDSIGMTEDVIKKHLDQVRKDQDPEHN